MNNPFNNNSDPLTAAAAAVLFNEDLTSVMKNVETVKVGDKTNFGVVKEIGDKFISFKGKDTPVTKIPFNQRKIGSKEFILDKLLKLKESVEELDESSNVVKNLMTQVRMLQQDEAAEFCDEFAKWLIPQSNDFEIGQFKKTGESLKELAKAIRKYEP